MAKLSERQAKLKRAAEARALLLSAFNKGAAANASYVLGADEIKSLLAHLKFSLPNLGQLLSRMVDNKLIRRVRPGVYGPLIDSPPKGEEGKTLPVRKKKVAPLQIDLARRNAAPLQIDLVKSTGRVRVTLQGLVIEIGILP